MDDAPTRRGPGQPSKLPEVREQLLALIENGINEAGACSVVKIGYSTYLGWLQRARAAQIAAAATGGEIPATETAFVEFSEAVQHAREGMQVRLEDHLRRTIPDMKPRDALEALSRLDRRWARKDKLEIQHTGSVDIGNAYGAQIAGLLQGILDELQLTDDQAARAPAIVARRLQLVADNAQHSDDDQDDDGEAGAAVVA